jgi:hypothetical protein
MHGHELDVSAEPRRTASTGCSGCGRTSAAASGAALERDHQRRAMGLGCDVLMRLAVLGARRSCGRSPR